MKALLFIATFLIILLISSFKQKPKAPVLISQNDTITIVTFKVKFVKQIIGPMCGCFYLPERNMFKTIVSFRHKQLAEKFIEVEYGDCKHYEFKEGEVYEIKARLVPSRRGYINVMTSPEPDKLISL